MAERHPVEVEADALMDAHDRNWETFRPENGWPPKCRQDLRDSIATALRAAQARGAEGMREEIARKITEVSNAITRTRTGPTAVAISEILDELAADIRALPVSDAPASPWRSADEAPEGVWLPTWREGEKRTSVAMKVTGDEWCAPDGRTTVTHSTYLPPTHFLPIPTPPAKDD